MEKEFTCHDCGAINTYNTRNLPGERVTLFEHRLPEDKSKTIEVVLNCKFCLAENVVNPYEDEEQ